MVDYCMKKYFLISYNVKFLCAIIVTIIAQNYDIVVLLCNSLGYDYTCYYNKAPWGITSTVTCYYYIAPWGITSTVTCYYYIAPWGITSSVTCYYYIAP